jgi:hypothetical protein
MSEANEPSRDAPAGRHPWFEEYVYRLRHVSVVRERGAGLKYPCPCCGCVTLDERGGYDICPVCFWEDDGQDDQDADAVRGGPNGPLSLIEARRNYRACGASEPRWVTKVRPPLPEESP